MTEHAAAPNAGLMIFAVDGAWPEARLIKGHGSDPSLGEAHVQLWFGSPFFDPQVPHVTMSSATAGNSNTLWILEQELSMYCDLGATPPIDLPAPEPISIRIDGEDVPVDVWRHGNGMSWVGRGRVGSTDLVLSGSKIDPRELRLMRIHSLDSFQRVGSF
ncbi:hypothetical protein [Streptomyces melanogenes]|uniref:hypothetical protein n=1 Tax=Streptomyces melanogenes TaxID=67326 RepID=UPI0037A72216